MDNVVKTDIACEPLADIKIACEPNLKDVENKPACESKQTEKVLPEIVKIKDITYKTLKKEGKVKGVYIEKPNSDSSSNSDSSNDSAILFPKPKNVPNQLFVKPGCSKATTSRLSSIVMRENSDCYDDTIWSSDGSNMQNDWKA